MKELLKQRRLLMGPRVVVAIARIVVALAFLPIASKCISAERAFPASDAASNSAGNVSNDRSNRAPTPAIEADEKILYKETKEKTLHLFVFKPAAWKQTDRRPALVYLHGGGWTVGNPGMAKPLAALLCERGFVVISAEYRLIAKDKEAHPAVCIEDAKSAMRYVRGHAVQFGIDPQRIAAGGASAGGHLSAACALLPTFDAQSDDLTISCKPNALVLMVPVLDNGPNGGYKGTVPSIRRNVKAYSPAHNVTKGAPPTIIFAARSDRAAHYPLLEKFMANMKQTGNVCEFHPYDGPHGVYLDKAVQPDTHQKVVAFFRQLDWIQQ